MKKYFWLLCLGGMLGACNSSNHSAKDNTSMEAVAATGTASYDANFLRFADQFKTVSLPYTLDTAQFLNGYEGEVPGKVEGVKAIDSNMWKTYLGAANIEEFQSYVEKETGQEPGTGVPKETAGSNAMIYSISQPIRTESFTALVVGCYDYGSAIARSGSSSYAVLCTFNPKGQFISSMLLAQDQDGDGETLYSSTVTAGTIQPDYSIETTTTQINGEYGKNRKKTKETTSSVVRKYQVAADGMIKLISEEDRN